MKWLRELFLTDRFIEFYSDKDFVFPTFSNSKIIFVGDLSQIKSNQISKVFKEISNRGKKYGFVHLSDEHLQHDLTFEGSPYKDPDCSFIIRNYPRNGLENFNKPIFTIGLGVPDRNFDKIFNSPSSIMPKTIEWSVACNMDFMHRKTFVYDFFMNGPRPFVISGTSGFNSTKSIDNDDYIKLLAQTKFILCPRGWVNDESFRIYEALEMKCIPIVPKSEVWKKIFGSEKIVFQTETSKNVPWNMYEKLLLDSQEAWNKIKFNWKSIISLHLNNL